MTPEENIQVNLGQIMHTAYIFAIRYWTSISCSVDSCENKVSTDQYHMTYHALKCRTHRVHVILTRLWIFIGLQAQVFSQIIRTSQKLGAPVSGLAKSIYCFLNNKEAVIGRCCWIFVWLFGSKPCLENIQPRGIGSQLWHGIHIPKINSQAPHSPLRQSPIWA